MFQSPFFFYPSVASFCSSSLLPTDYELSSRCAPAHRLPRFASCRLSLSLFPSLFSLFAFPLYLLLPPSFSFLRRRGSKYTPSLLQWSSVSFSRLPQESACSSLFFHATRLDSTRPESNSLSLSLFHSSSLFSRTNYSPSSSILRRSLDSFRLYRVLSASLTWFSQQVTSSLCVFLMANASVLCKIMGQNYKPKLPLKRWLTTFFLRVMVHSKNRNWLSAAICNLSVLCYVFQAKACHQTKVKCELEKESVRLKSVRVGHPIYSSRAI